LSAFVGCGGGGGGSKDAGKTFEGDGYSFAYPAEWAEQGGDTNTGRIDALVAPPQGGRNAVALTVVRHAVAKPVTDATIDQTVHAIPFVVAVASLGEICPYSPSGTKFCGSGGRTGGHDANTLRARTSAR
jgi:hypothetical protein